MLTTLLGQPRRRAAAGDPDDWTRWNSGAGRRRTQAGTVVDEDLALTYSACWCATRILAETAASLPLFLYRRGKSDDREQAVDHPLYDLLKTSPNPAMGSMAFREGRTSHQVNWGNGFAEIERQRPADPQSPVLALWPIHPCRVRPVRPGDTDAYGRALLGSYGYVVRNNDGTSVALKPHEMLHVPGVLSEDGVWGKGVVSYARESIGMGLATERHGATQFGAGNIPKAVVHLPGLKDSEARKQFRREWREIHGSPDAGDVAILPVEGKLEKLSFSNEDAQFLGTRKHNVLEVARWYRVPPHMLSELMGPAGYNSVEMFSLEFIIYSLLPWLRRWEEQICLKLLTVEERKEYYAEHELAGLLRGDFQTRMSGYKTAISTGLLTINEARRLENKNGIGAAGDQHYLPLNMTTAEKMAAAPDAPAADALADPPAAALGEPGAELLDVPDRRQSGDYDCGAACTHAVADYFGVGAGRQESDYVAELGTTPPAGTTPEAIVDWFNDQGLITTSGPGMTLDDLRRFFEAGKPVIVPLQLQGATPEYDGEEAADRAGHYVVVIGVGLGQVFFQDPLAGRQMLDAEEFDRRWHDVEADGASADHFGIAVGETATEGGAEPAETGPTDPEDEQEAEGPAAEPDPEPAGLAEPSGQNVKAAARQVLVDVLARMFTKEANAAERAARGDDFDGWLADFYTRHEQLLSEALSPACSVLAAAGLAIRPEFLAFRLKADSRQLLLAAYDGLSREQFNARLAEWPTARAAATADRILSGDYADA